MLDGTSMSAFAGQHPLLFFFNDTATTEIYTVMNTLSLHDALPISPGACPRARCCARRWRWLPSRSEEHTSELQSLITISYAVFCLKKKKTKTDRTHNAYSKSETRVEIRKKQQ